jgi:hypothetical protein
VDENSPHDYTSEPDGAQSARIHCADGTVRVDGDAGASAELRWSSEDIRVKLFGEPVSGSMCRVPVGARVDIAVESVPARVDYQVEIARDRMAATLRVVQVSGVERTICSTSEAPGVLRLDVTETAVDAPDASVADARAEVQTAGIVHGLDEAALAAAVAEPGDAVTIATGTEPIEGRNGYLEPLVDFEAVRMAGVLDGTPLVRRVSRREGIAGCDVTGRPISVAVTKDVRIIEGEGAAVDEQGIMAIAIVDGAPRLSSEGHIEVQHELVLAEVDTLTGDVQFNGSVRVTGHVHEGRKLIARDEIVVEGNVDRAVIESGSSIRVDGSIMSSVLRAGGERAVAATIADRVLELPRQLGVVSGQARQFRDQAIGRGTEISHGLSLQLVLERIHKSVLPTIASVADDLAEAGPSHQSAAERVSRWHRQLATAANNSLRPEEFQSILLEVGALVDDIRKAIDRPADLFVNYMQTSEAEATGTVTLDGKGIFNSRIVAWGGLLATHIEAVVRGGSMVSQGDVRVREIGSPAGAKTSVQLGKNASLQADRVYAGTVVSGPGYAHRFVADRSSVNVVFDSGGSMNVESLAA